MSIDLKKEKAKSRVQMVKEITNRGTMVEYLVIDGVKAGMMGSVSESDREEGIRTIQKIVENSNKKGHELIREIEETLTSACEMNEKEIDPNRIEELEITSEETGAIYTVILDWSKNKVYVDNVELKEVSNVEDLGDNARITPREVLKTILVERAKKALETEETEEYEDEDDDWE